MTIPDAAKLLLEAQLKALAANMDVKNPLADMKAQVTALADALKAVRGTNASRADNDAQVTFMHVMSAANMLDRNTLGEMRSTLDEVEAVRAHVALASATMAKLIATVTAQVEASVKREVERAAAQPAGKTLRLQIHVPGMAITEKTFVDPIVKVGQLPTSHLNLPDENVGRMHAVIERVDVPGGGVTHQSEPGWYVIDLGTAAGTIVNDRKVNKAKLMVGDSMLFGGVNVRVLG